jgi:CSLREA domain-containing protein
MASQTGYTSMQHLVRHACAVVIFFAVSACFGSCGALAATFTVNSTADVHDANAGDGICETALGNHVCTLRAAIEEANKLAGADTIALQANAKYLLSLTSTVDNFTSDLNVIDSVAITGAGPNSTVIDGNGASTGHRVFAIMYRCVGNVVNQQNQSCTNGDVSVSMSGLTIKNGFSANLAGGIYNVGILALDNVAVTDNTASGLNDWGGGIYNAGPLTMTNCLLANNKTGAHNAYGGGMYNQGTLTITNSTISGNSTYSGTSSPGQGGGLFLIGYAVTIRNSTITGNRAAVGGGIYHGGYPAVLINDTISGNFSDGNGGGLHNNSGTTGLYNVTVTQNQANEDDAGSGIGGGISNAAAGTLTLIDSIVAHNEVVIPTMPFPTLGLDECAGTITSQGYNVLEFVDTNHCAVTGPYSADNPLLGPLQFNGGLTRTHAISPGGSAVDKGNPSGCTDDLGAGVTTDQRGVHRPSGSACDIGAFEYVELIFKNGFEPL